jgi:hypothetical protein
MIYTIGSKKAYLRSFLKNHRVIKPGRTRGYSGGCAFKNREDAQRHIDELDLQGYRGFAVFGVLANWERDTAPSKDHWWHDLLVDSEVVVLEKPEEELVER